MNETKDFEKLQEREEELFAQFLEKTQINTDTDTITDTDEINEVKDFLPDFSELKNHRRDNAWKKLSVFWHLFFKKENFVKTSGILVPAVLTFFLILNILTPSAKVSEKENRALSQFPKISFASLTSGQFMKDFESYITDQFVFRNGFVSLKKNLETLSGKEENHNILMCDDGYLIENTSELTVKNISSNIAAINDLSSVDRYNVKVAVVPTAYEILKDKLPLFAYTNSYEKLQKKLTDGLESAVNADVAEALREKSGEYIYYHSDHHQTALGSYYTYKALGEYLGFEPYPIEDFDVETMAEDFVGTTWSNSGFAKTKKDIIYKYTHKDKHNYAVSFDDETKDKATLYSEDKLENKDKYAYYLDGNHATAKITSSCGTGKKIAIIKDSYAHSVVPFLANHFSEIYMLDLRYYNGDVFEYLYEHNIGDILILYNQNTFMTDTNLSKISALSDTSVYTSVPDISYGVVPEIAGGDASYFDDAIFVGDSLTIGIQNFSGFGAQFLCMGGLSTRNLETAALPNGKTVMQSIRDTQNLGKIYIMFGTNEIAFDEMDEFLERYSKFIDSIREVHPEALVYIESIMPVTKEKSESTDIKNDRIYVYNEALLKMAKEKQCYYIDIHSYFKGEDGYLPSNIGSDGIHLGPDKYREMAAYIQNHAVPVAGAKKIDTKAKVTFAGGGTIDTQKIGEKILDAIEFKDELIKVTDSLVISAYMPDPQKVCSASLFLGGGATAEEVAVFEMKSGKDAKELETLVKKRIERKKKDFENYIPQELTKLGSPVIVRKSNLVIVCIADDVTKDDITKLLK